MQCVSFGVFVVNDSVAITGTDRAIAIFVLANVD